MNRLIVVGATRGTGLCIARELLERGLDPVLVVRDGARGLPLPGPSATVVQADVNVPSTLARVFANGTSALFYTVDITGGFGGRGFFQSRSKIREVVYGGVVNIAEAAREADWTGHFVLLTTLGPEKPNWLFEFIAERMKPGAMQASRDKAAYLRSSGLSFTIVQAGALHDGSDSGIDVAIGQEEVPSKWCGGERLMRVVMTGGTSGVGL